MLGSFDYVLQDCKFRIGQLVILDGRFKVKFIGCNFGKAQIRSAGYTRYVDFDRISHILN